MPATFWPVFLENRPRPGISPGACLGRRTFEARKPKDHAIISETEGRVEFGKDYKSKRRIIVVPTDASEEPTEYLIPKGKHISVQEGDYVAVGDPLMDGNPVPHDILRVLGVEALAEYLIKEIQDVYRLQGVKINNKHIEVISRQMLRKIEVVQPGDSTYLVGELADRDEFDAENDKILANGGLVAKGEPVLQGITKASLQTKSFISAASFQETTRVNRSRCFRQGGYPIRVEGKRDRRTLDSRRNRFRDEPVREIARSTRRRNGQGFGSRGIAGFGVEQLRRDRGSEFLPGS